MAMANSAATKWANAEKAKQGLALKTANSRNTLFLNAGCALRAGVLLCLGESAGNESLVPKSDSSLDSLVPIGSVDNVPARPQATDGHRTSIFT